MDEKTKADVRLYMNRARLDLQAVEVNLQNGFYAVAVSRAYYAMFYAVTALLKSNGIDRSKHSGVIAAFGQYFVKTGLIEIEFAKILTHAFNSRNDTDYDLIWMPDVKLARTEMEDAQRFVERVERYFQDKGEL
ncbi:MAG: HEPN domain-containing protein [Candidatus Promineifilaceae bacterium]